MPGTGERQGSQSTAAHPPAGTPTEVVADGSLELQNRLVKSLIPAGAFRTDDHRYYWNGEGPLPSVTTVLEILDKPALTTWKAKEAARAMLRMTQHGWPDSVPQDEEEAVKRALSESRKGRDTAANVGSGVHHLADMALRVSESDPNAWQVSDDTQPYLDAFRVFSDRYERSSFVSSEKMVWSLNGYAGTYDLLMMIGNELWLIDIKTGKGIDYPEYALQLAGYRWADYIILEGNPVRYDMPDVQRTGILHLRPDLYTDTGYRLFDVPTDYTEDYIPFLGLVEAYKWRQRRMKVKPISQRD